MNGTGIGAGSGCAAHQYCSGACSFAKSAVRLPIWRNNLAVYAETGRLLEKYDVIEIGRLAGGGEYGVQDGFGWTNGVLQCLVGELAIDC